MQIPDVLEALRESVDNALARALDLREGVPAALGKAMGYALLGSGKRLRPALVLLGARSVGAVEDDVAMPTACAFEMVHAYSLAHDDLPAMDNDDLRRGKPTCHKKYGEAAAILAGDGLLTLAFDHVARFQEPRDAALEVVRILADAGGAAGMVGGQALDMAAQGERAGPDTVRAIHRLKTAALIRGATLCGGVVGGASVDQRAALERYGENLGLAFQVTDDLLDVCSNTKDMGKVTGKDAEAGKATYPGVLGVEAARDEARALARLAVDALDDIPQPRELRALAMFVVERRS